MNWYFNNLFFSLVLISSFFCYSNEKLNEIGTISESIKPKLTSGSGLLDAAFGRNGFNEVFSTACEYADDTDPKAKKFGMTLLKELHLSGFQYAATDRLVTIHAQENNLKMAQAYLESSGYPPHQLECAKKYFEENQRKKAFKYLANACWPSIIQADFVNEQEEVVTKDLLVHLHAPAIKKAAREYNKEFGKEQAALYYGHLAYSLTNDLSWTKLLGDIYYRLFEPEKAYICFDVAAQYGNWDAKIKTASMIYTGQGIKKDSYEGFKQLADLIVDSDTPPKSKQKALAILQKLAVKKNDFIAQSFLIPILLETGKPGIGIHLFDKVTHYLMETDDENKTKVKNFINTSLFGKVNEYAEKHNSYYGQRVKHCIADLFLHAGNYEEAFKRYHLFIKYQPKIGSQLSHLLAEPIICSQLSYLLSEIDNLVKQGELQKIKSIFMEYQETIGNFYINHTKFPDQLLYIIITMFKTNQECSLNLLEKLIQTRTLSSNKFILNQIVTQLKKNSSKNPQASYVLFLIFDKNYIKNNGKEARKYFAKALRDEYPQAVFLDVQKKSTHKGVDLWYFIKKYVDSQNKQENELTDQARKILEKLAQLGDIEACYAMCDLLITIQPSEALNYLNKAEDQVNEKSLQRAEIFDIENLLIKCSNSSFDVTQALAKFYEKRSQKKSYKQKACSTYIKLLSQHNDEYNYDIILNKLLKYAQSGNVDAIETILNVYINHNHDHLFSKKIVHVLDKMDSKPFDLLKKSNVISKLIDTVCKNNDTELYYPLGEYLIRVNKPASKWFELGMELLQKVSNQNIKAKNMLFDVYLQDPESYEKAGQLLDSVICSIDENNKSDVQFLNQSIAALEKFAPKNKDIAYSLAIIFEKGISSVINADQKRALAFKMQAANQGHAKALFECGVHLLEQNMDPKSIKKAIYFFGQAMFADQEEHLNEAIKILTFLMENGHPEAFCVLVNNLFDVYPDKNRALEHFQKGVQFFCRLPIILLPHLKKEGLYDRINNISKENGSASYLLGLIYIDAIEKQKKSIEYSLPELIIAEKYLKQALNLELKEDEKKIAQKYLKNICETIVCHYIENDQLEKAEPYAEYLDTTGNMHFSFALSKQLIIKSNDQERKKGYELLKKSAHKNLHSAMLLGDLECECCEIIRNAGIERDHIINLLLDHRKNCSVLDCLYIDNLLKKLKVDIKFLDPQEIKNRLPENNNGEKECAQALYFLQNRFFNKAFELFTKAEELGNIHAKAYLGKMYIEGFGVEQSIEKGIILLDYFIKNLQIKLHQYNELHLQEEVLSILNDVVPQINQEMLEMGFLGLINCMKPIIEKDAVKQKNLYCTIPAYLPLIHYELKLFKTQHNLEFLRRLLSCFDNFIEILVASEYFNPEVETQVNNLFEYLDKNRLNYPMISYSLGKNFCLGAQFKRQIFNVPFDVLTYYNKAKEYAEYALLKEENPSEQKKYKYDLCSIILCKAQWINSNAFDYKVITQLYEEAFNVDPCHEGLVKIINFFYLNGNAKLSSDESIELALKWLEKLAQKNNIEAQRFLWRRLIKGTDTLGCGGKITPNIEKGIKYLKMAAENEDRDAIAALAMIYKDGIQHKKNINEAIKLYEKAIAKGYYDGYQKLGEIYFERTEYQKAWEYFNHESMQNNATVLIYKCIMLLKGLGVEESEDKGLDLFEHVLDELEKKFKGESWNTIYKSLLLDNLLLLAERKNSERISLLLARYNIQAIRLVTNLDIGDLFNNARRYLQKAANSKNKLIVAQGACASIDLKLTLEKRKQPDIVELFQIIKIAFKHIIIDENTQESKFINNYTQSVANKFLNFLKEHAKQEKYKQILRDYVELLNDKKVLRLVREYNKQNNDVTK
ncbi:MAG: tetratricopeptide repeat protein [Candidatus Babeliales bacterium]